MFFGQEFLSNINNSQLGMLYKTDAQRQNSVAHMMLFNHWSNLAVTRFDWSGLPSGVDERILNMGLYLMGTCAFYEDENIGLTALPCTPGSRFNFLYQPTEVQVFGYGMTKFLNDPAKFGFIRVNPTSSPLAIVVYELTKRMADIMRTLDVINKRLKRPYMFSCEEKQRLTLLNMFKKINDNEEIVLGLKDYSIGQPTFEVKELPLPPREYTTVLWNTYHEYERILYAMMGVQTLPDSKRERMVVDEVNANNMAIELANETNLKELTICVEAANKKFDVSISVSIKELKSFDDNEGFEYSDDNEPGEGS